MYKSGIDVMNAANDVVSQYVAPSTFWEPNLGSTTKQMWEKQILLGWLIN